MRGAMFGYQTWGHRTLQALLDSAHEVVMAVARPKSDHVYEKIWDDSVADLAEKYGIPVLLRNRRTTPNSALCYGSWRRTFSARSPSERATR